MNLDSKIYIAGHRGLVGSAIWKQLKSKGYTNLIGKTSSELNLMDAVATQKFFEEEKPEYVFLAAAHVGGIMANNTYRADFIYNNLQIQQNVIYNAYQFGVKKLLFLGSTCIYPKEATQPINEDELLTNVLEYTNEPYAIAKIAGIKLCESFNIQYDTNFISVMPTNLYGPNDNFDLEKSHVLPAMIRKIFLSKCLMDNNIELLKKDFNKRPVEGINGEHSLEEIKAILDEVDNGLKLATHPSVILVVGVNGVGKTTSIGKIANRLKQDGKKVVIAAADTFRAAAVEQLEIWANRAGCDIVKKEEGTDPASVVFDAIQITKQKNADVLICDTAGRLHNKKYLMDELVKIKKVIDKELPESSKEVLMVLDATTGQNAISQVKAFKETVDINGLILTKLDGTAKGGVVVGIVAENQMPVKFVGVGEQIDDMEIFNSADFVNALI